MAKYLDQTGLTYFWGKIKAKINSLTADKIGYSNDLIEADGNVKAALDVLAQVASEYAEHDHDDKYVPLTRTIAGIDLKTNIAAEDLTSKLLAASPTASGLMSKDHYSKLSALPTKTELDSNYAKKTDISSVYKAMGSVDDIHGLPEAIAAHLGYVCNVSLAFTTTSTFLEGAGVSYPAGTNVVVVESDGSYYHDTLAGFVDLSNYATKDDLDSVEVDAITPAEIDTIVAS